MVDRPVSRIRRMATHPEALGAHCFENKKHSAKNDDVHADFGLRRSRSFSSAAFLGNTRERNLSCMSERSSSPSTSSSSVKAQKHNQSSRSRMLTPERHVRTKRIPAAAKFSQASHDRSRNTSISSSDVSNEVLDLYIDGEQHHHGGSPMRKTSFKNHTRTRGSKRPPRVHSTAPGSPIGSIKDKPRVQSSRGVNEAEHYFSSRDWVETGFGHGSPQELAKHVVEKLCQSRNWQSNSNDYDPGVPITIEDVYGGSMNRDVAPKLNNPNNNVHQAGNNNDGIYDADNEDGLDLELESKLKEAQDRILSLSEELEQESYLQDVDFNVPALIQRIRSLTEEKISLALDVSAVLESQLADRTSLKEQLRSARLELDSRTKRLQEEKNEVQSVLEKELDRRSSDWSSKVEKCKEEEQRLRERVRELAEQNVSLQREVSSFSEMETERKNTISMLESAREENQDYHQSICELQDKYKMVEEVETIFKVVTERKRRSARNCIRV
ncbi:Centriolin [Bienertia sinuspersici]